MAKMDTRIRIHIRNSEEICLPYTFWKIPKTRMSTITFLLTKINTGLVSTMYAKELLLSHLLQYQRQIEKFCSKSLAPNFVHLSKLG